MDWKKIKAEYIAGGTSYRKLAEKYKVSFSVLRKIAAKEQWTELRRNVGAKRDTVLVDKIGNITAEIDEKYFSLVDKLLNKAEEVIDKTTTWQASGIKEMATALKYLKECKGVKSGIDMREQEARIRLLEQQSQKTDEAPQITVVFGSDEDYAK